MSTPRNPENERHMATFRLPNDLLDRLTVEARKRVMGRAKFVELLLERALADLAEPSLEAPTVGRPTTDAGTDSAAPLSISSTPTPGRTTDV